MPLPAVANRRAPARGSDGQPLSPSRSWLYNSLAFALVLLAWQLLATALAGRYVIASPPEIVVALVDARHVWADNVRATVVPAASGWAVGTAVGSLLAALALLVPSAERPALRVAAAIYSLPLVAVAPVLQVTLSGAGPSTVLAALTVVFTTTVTIVEGLRAAPSSVLAVSRGLGASPLRILVSVRARAALPMMLTSLRISWPAALIGALIGEYLGGTSGLGVYMVQQASQLETAQVWAAATLITAIALIGIVAAGATARRMVQVADVDMSVRPAAPARSSLARVGASVRTNAITVVVFCALWVGYLWLFQVDPFVGRTPVDVVDYLLDGPGRDVLADTLGSTLRDIGTGLAVGWLAGALLAMLFFASAILARLLMPIAAAMAAVPILAVIPLLTMAFGYGLAGVVVIVAIIVFFPTMILVLDGLRSAPADLLAVARSYGATRSAVLLRIRIPYALPALATGLRIACPLAVIGALLAQWLTSGHGLGYLMLADSISYNYDRLWAATVLTTLIAVTAYALSESCERAVLARFSDSAR